MFAFWQHNNNYKQLHGEASVVSNNGTVRSDLSAKLNKLEDQVAKLTIQIKTNKQTISELKLALSERDMQLRALEVKLGYAQQSLLEKAMHKIEACRIQVKTEIDEKVINPTVTQIQQQIKTAQEFVDEAKTILIGKKKLIDSQILMARDKAVQCPEQARLYVENSVIKPAQVLLNQTLQTINNQVKTTQSVVENKAIYPGKVLLDGMVTTAQSLPDKFQTLLQAQVLDRLAKGTKKAANIYPNTLTYLGKTTGRISDIFNQALSEITNQVKKSSFWDGKNKIKATY
jgi:hypothetical protein